MKKAACKGLPLKWWYPDRGDSTAKARAVCRECPVIKECLEHHLAIIPMGEDRSGIVANTTYRDRIELRRKFKAGRLPV